MALCINTHCLTVERDPPQCNPCYEEIHLIGLSFLEGFTGRIPLLPSVIFISNPWFILTYQAPNIYESSIL